MAGASRYDPRRTSISAMCLYMAGGFLTAGSLTLLLAPTEASFGPGLVGSGLGVAVIGIGRIVAMLNAILHELRDYRDRS